MQYRWCANTAVIVDSYTSVSPNEIQGINKTIERERRSVGSLQGGRKHYKWLYISNY